MGKIKYIKDIRNFFMKNPIVQITSLKKFISNYRGNKNYIYLLINKMLKKGEIKRITKGYYSIQDNPVLAVFCFKPSYLGLQNAISTHNLWQQETNPIIITTKRIRQGTRVIFNNNVYLKRISPKYFFGIGYMKEGNLFIPVSDIEKTFIDMIYFRQKLDKDLLKNFKKRIDTKKLKDYLKKYPKRISTKILTLLSQ